MASFDVIEHIIPASYLREYAGGTTSAVRPPVLQLAIKQYVPRSSPTPSDGDLTIILCHANGFHKELYEPFLEDLASLLRSSGVGIRSIWALDAAHQGASGILNEEVLGDDPCWNDYPRDVLQMVDFFQKQMQPPIFGIGHSFGGHAIVRASLMHPSLFTALVLLDPVIEEHRVIDSATAPARASARRQDIWPDYASAEKYFRSRAFYKRWDPRVLDIHLKYGIRPLPTATYPDQKGVTLATTKHQEVFTFLRPYPMGNGSGHTLGRKEHGITFQYLHTLSPPVQLIVGGRSEVSPARANQRKMERIPTAELVVIEPAGHLIPQEEPNATAEAAAPYLVKQVKLWKNWAEADRGKPRNKHLPEDFFPTIPSKI